MSEKLKEYQVLDILCGGTFYKVRHKVTNKIFSWKAYNCSSYSDEQIQNAVNEVKVISKLISRSLLQFYDTILHVPSKTLYFVLEYNSWRSVCELIAICKVTDKYIVENFIWYLLHELAKICKAIEKVNFQVLQKTITSESIFVDENCELRVNCFDLTSRHETRVDLMRQVGDVISALCYKSEVNYNTISEFHYTDDLRDIVAFLTDDDRNAPLRPEVVLYHPTVLANLETNTKSHNLSDIIVSVQLADSNKCDSEKAIELDSAVQPAPRRHFKPVESPIYCNITPKKEYLEKKAESCSTSRNSLSPTLAALALELPGFVPRSRKPLNNAVAAYNPQTVSQETLSEQWMSRLVALRQREESLNKREREIMSKEILNSPAAKIVPFKDPQLAQDEVTSNGITLPPMLTQVGVREQWVTRRRPQSSSMRARSTNRRKTFAYEDLDSSLSADTGDGSLIITAKKFTKENMPRRNIFPEVSNKKVHFTSSNPFVESDESVTLTFYELENVDREAYQARKTDENMLKDITKFKYLDLEKVTLDKRAAMQQWTQSSPSKQPRLSKTIFSDITNHSIRKTPSKTSLTSKGSTSSKCSLASGKSQWSIDSGWSKPSEDNVSNRLRSSVRQSLAPTPTEIDKKPKSRKSLLPFKTPFKFSSKSSKV